MRRSHPQPCVQWKKARKQVTTGTPKQSGIPCTMVYGLYVLSPVYRYSIHTFLSLRVVPYLIRRKASRPNRMTIGPGFP
jgi:hypothetical protein